MISIFLPVRRSFVFVLLLTVSVAVLGVAQESPPATQPSANQVPSVPAASSPSPQTAQSAGAAPTTSSSAAPVKLLIGAGDEGEMSVYGMPDLTTRFHVSSEGEVNLPLIGTYKIGGKTAEQAELEIQKKYVDGGFLRSPQITILVKEYTTQGVSVMGEVARPGVYSALAARRLFDAFLAAGGLTQRASRTITVQHADDKQPADVITLNSDLMATPETNPTLKPGDSVIVGRAGVVYVIGEVNRPGEFVITAGTQMTALQVMAMAAGPSRYASLGKTKLMHQTPQGIQTSEIDLKKIMEAKAKDVALNSNDILFIPSSKGKIAADRGGSSVLSMLSSLALYRF